jgi:hypothetical protein
VAWDNSAAFYSDIKEGPESNNYQERYAHALDEQSPWNFQDDGNWRELLQIIEAACCGRLQGVTNIQ